MKGDARVIDLLNQALTAELTAINQYFIHSELCENYGYELLHHQIKKDSIDEMKHAEKLIERILFLDGQPNMSRYNEIRVGSKVEDILKNDLAAHRNFQPHFARRRPLLGARVSANRPGLF
jgi:bacterioferritin